MQDESFARLSTRWIRRKSQKNFVSKTSTGVVFSTSATCFGRDGNGSTYQRFRKRAKWNKVKRNLKVDDVVLVRDENAPRNVWPMGVVTKVEPDSKGLVRSVVLRTHTTELHRPVNKLILMLTTEERMDATQDIEEVADKLVQTVKQ